MQLKVCVMAQEVEEQLEQVYEIDYQLQRLDAREDGAMNVLKGIQVPLMHMHLSMCCPAATTANAPAWSFQHLSVHPSLSLSAPERMRQQSPTWHAGVLRSVSPLHRRSWWGWD